MSASSVVAELAKIYAFDVFNFFRFSIKFCECSPCVHREHCFLFGDVASGKRTDLCIHGSP